jgi:hypothetical protein
MGPQNYPQNNAPQLPGPYDFLNASPAPKRGILGGGGPKNKLLVSVIFVTAVLTFVVIGIAVFSALTSKDYTAYTNMLKTQYEIVRVTDLGLASARTPEAKNFVATIHYVTETQKASTLETLKKAGIKVNDKQLALAKDAANDKALDTAEQANRYDEKLTELVNQLLVTYQKQAKEASALATTSSEKALFESIQKNLNTIGGTLAKK